MDAGGKKLILSIERDGRAAAENGLYGKDVDQTGTIFFLAIRRSEKTDGYDVRCSVRFDFNVKSHSI